MRKYFIKTPWWLKQVYSNYTWDMDAGERKEIYLTFDDGPHPDITPFVLDLLKAYNAKATFFCIGKNVAANPGVYQRIIAEGHTVGNHTMHHLNGWKTDTETYSADVREASGLIRSSLFRPPYGRIKRAQAKRISAALGCSHGRIIMWDVLSGDFDESIDGTRCTTNVIKHTVPGSIIVFHDSVKAMPRLSVSLPLVLAHFTKENYHFENIRVDQDQ